MSIQGPPIGPTYAQLLLSIDLGDEVAEVDPALIETFVRTADFDEFLTGRCDLITGIKGSGKSALLLMAMNSSPPGVRMVKAQPLRGPVIYEADLPAQLTGRDLEDYYLERWLLHSVLTAAYSLLDNDESGHIERLLERSGLPVERGESEIGIWVSTGRLMRNVDVNNMAFANEVVRLLDGLLEKVGESVWVLYDRLDDVTFTRPEIEQLVLRGLLRAHIYLLRASHSVSSKLFLRSDILDRATLDEGLRNLDKVPALRLNMNARDVSLLLAKRFLQSSEFVAEVGLRGADLDSDDAVQKVMRRILPTASRENRRKPNLLDLYGRYFYDTTDGSGRFSARNVLAYMRLGLVQQRRICEDRQLLQVPRTGPVLSEKALHSAWVQLSENRLHSYVYAEFSSIRSFVERLEYGPSQYRNLESLGRRFFHENYTLEETRLVVEMLKYCGVLGDAKERIQVGRVYRPALRCQNSDPSSNQGTRSRGSSQRTASRATTARTEES